MSYNPASILTSGQLPNLVATYYERKAVANLKAETPFLEQTTQKPLPLHSGHQIQFYTYALLGANTNQTSEGTVGSPITESTTAITATIGQYADFINTSDLSLDVAIDENGLLNNLSDELSYRAGLTLNSLVQLTADTATTVDTAVNLAVPHGSFLTANIVRSVVQSLAAVNAKPKDSDGGFGGIIHPAVVRDILNDTSNNGLSDILKRGDADRQILLSALNNKMPITFAGVKFMQTSTAPTTLINGYTNYNTYIFGQDAIFSVFLGQSESGDKPYKMNIQQAPENGSVSDPARMIGGWCSYNLRWTSTLRPGSTMTMRRIQSETATM